MPPRRPRSRRQAAGVMGLRQAANTASNTVGLSALDQKYGKANVVSLPFMNALGIPPFTFPIGNYVFLPGSREKYSDDYISELSHIVQANQDHKNVNSYNIANKLNFNQGLGYKEPGNIEYNAHSEIEPYVRQTYNKAIGLPYQTDEQIEKTKNYKDSLYRKSEEDYQKLMSTLKKGGYEAQEARAMIAQKYAKPSRQSMAYTMGVTDNLKFIGNQIQGVYSDMLKSYSKRSENIKKGVKRGYRPR